MLSKPAFSKEEITVYTAFQIGAHDVTGEVDTTYRFFEGPLPKIGQCVEFKYVGKSPEGELRLQLHTKECAKDTK